MACVCGSPHKDSAVCMCVRAWVMSVLLCALSATHTHYQCYRCRTPHCKLCHHNHFNWNFGEVCVCVRAHVCVCACVCAPIKHAMINPFADGEVAKLLSEASNQNCLSFPSSESSCFSFRCFCHSRILTVISVGACNVTPLIGQIKRYICRKTSKCSTKAFEDVLQAGYNSKQKPDRNLVYPSISVFMTGRTKTYPRNFWQRITHKQIKLFCSLWSLSRWSTKAFSHVCIRIISSCGTHVWPQFNLVG